LISEFGALNAEFFGLAVDALNGGALVEELLEIGGLTVNLMADLARPTPERSAHTLLSG
jgi:hypothetical protein